MFEITISRIASCLHSAPSPVQVAKCIIEINNLEYTLKDMPSVGTRKVECFGTLAELKAKCHSLMLTLETYQITGSIIKLQQIQKQMLKRAIKHLELANELRATYTEISTQINILSIYQS